jgi:hypothetical protein
MKGEGTQDREPPGLRATMLIWQRNHAGGNISTRVIQVTDALFHAEATDERERTATLEGRLRPTLDLAQARADEMARRHFRHDCDANLCDRWHLIPGGVRHGAPYPLPVEAAEPESANLLVVERGRTAWADFLRQRLGSIGERVHFAWDRRLGERRRRGDAVELDRRAGDRRTRPPLAWRTLHFVLVYSAEALTRRD